MWHWIERIEAYFQAMSWAQRLLWTSCVFLASFFGSIALVAFVVVQLPSDYFSQDNHPPAFAWAQKYPYLRWPALIVKNIVGFLLIVTGIILSLPGVPGQGILTILVGVMLVNFPGKRWLERKIVARPTVLKLINKLRARYNRPPMIAPADCPGPASDLEDFK